MSRRLSPCPRCTLFPAGVTAPAGIEFTRPADASPSLLITQDMAISHGPAGASGSTLRDDEEATAGGGEWASAAAAAAGGRSDFQPAPTTG